MPFKFLTPKVSKKTLKKRRQRSYEFAKKLEKFQSLTCPLIVDQGNEMRDIVTTIETQFSEELNKLFSENKQGDTVRKIWENDLKENKISFMKDQAKTWETLGIGSVR